MPGKTGLIGYYGKYGYRICTYVNGMADEDVYTAGNCPGDSVAVVDPSEGESIETLKGYCEQTGRELAEEMGQEWLGCDPEDEEEDEDEADT